jgi:3'-phosphoadenosine 5'-phosphosulfate sulfotransferase (PAPS reductase)/FAD synthetase
VTATVERLAGRHVVASVSGGKDSAAMALYLRELGVPFTAVFADTGWEHPETYRYLWDEIAPRFGLTVVRGPRLMAELVQHKGMFPSRARRFCTQLLKVYPLRDYIRSLDDDVVNAIGIRAAESQARAKLPEWEHNAEFDCDTWRPLIAWSTADVIALHRRHGLPLNPLYAMGAERVGCWPCIYARKAEIRLIADTDPARIAEIRALESNVQAAAAAHRYARYGESYDSLGYHLPTFFVTSDRADRNRMTPIDDVVQWSRTSRGGKQYELFASGADGCMRWGMCETASEEP